ncbi:MAG: class I SAM-dependent methyltransferase, partial [Methylophilaceae bacterium]
MTSECLPISEYRYEPSAWLVNHAHHIKSEGLVLDVAAGFGRNARWLATQGYEVTAVDKDAIGLESMAGITNIRAQLADIEADGWPYAEQAFDAIVVCRYLHRPLFPKLIQSLAPGGALIYETFMEGQQAYGRPQNPDFLLKSNELLQIFSPELTIVAFEQGLLQ